MQIHSKRRKRSNSARKRKHMELRAIASFACKVRVQDLGTRMKRAWSNERRHRSFSLVYVSPKWNFYKLKSFSQNSLYFTSFVRSGRITGPVSIFIMGHFVALCAIRAWRTAFLIPAAVLQIAKNFHQTIWQTIEDNRDSTGYHVKLNQVNIPLNELRHDSTQEVSPHSVYPRRISFQRTQNLTTVH